MPKTPPERPVLLNWIKLDRKADISLYKQIVSQIREAILLGNLDVGVTLPASRALSVDLGVSRITTIQAYEQLIAEGFLETQRGSGTWVSQALSKSHLANLAAVRKEFEPAPNQSQKHVLQVFGEEATSVAFQPGIPAFDAFPRAIWSRLLARNATRADPFLLDYSNVGGYYPLRQQIAKYLRGSRGVQCAPEQVIVVTSVRSAIAAVCSVLWQFGSTVAVEDPGYRVARSVLTACGCRLHPVPLDERGFRVSDLLTGQASCVGAYLTPAHNWPMGVALAAERRVQLLDWAVKSGAWIIEDDYDSEFRFESQPLDTLHALGSGRVIYIGTFSKTLAPSLRTAYLVVPQAHVPNFEKHTFQSAIEPSLHVQAALSDLLAEGHFIRHIARMRKLYTRRRRALVEALQTTFQHRMEIICPPGGLQIIAKLPNHISAAEVSHRANSINIIARNLITYHISQPSPNALHLGFAAVPENEIGPAVERLAGAIHTLW